MISSLVTFLVVGLVVVVALGLVLTLVGALLGAALSVAGFLLFKVAPVLLVGYLVVRFLRPRQDRLSAADRKWLNS